MSIIISFIASKAPISHKYLNHGKSVPIQKCSKYNNHFLNSFKFTLPLVLSVKQIRAYSSTNDNHSNHGQFTPVGIYENAFSMKKTILKDNDGKAGIYMFANKITGDIYYSRRETGQSVDLRKRFINYFNLNYINRRNELVISRALIKYGYSNFSLTILEYCDKSDLDVREQYYFYSLNPQYNIQKVAGGSSKGLILSEETKNKISKALKGVYPSLFLPQFRLYISAIRYYSSQSDANGFHNTSRSRVLAQIIGKNPLFYDDSFKFKKLILENNKEKSGIYM